MKKKPASPPRIFRIRTSRPQDPERLTPTAQAVRKLVMDKLADDELWSTADVARALGVGRNSDAIAAGLDAYRAVRPGLTTLYGRPETIRAYLASRQNHSA